MSDHPEREQDQDPQPIKHSDAERVSAEESARVPAGKDAHKERDDQTPERP